MKIYLVVVKGKSVLMAQISNMFFIGILYTTSIKSVVLISNQNVAACKTTRYIFVRLETVMMIRFVLLEIAG